MQVWYFVLAAFGAFGKCWCDIGELCTSWNPETVRVNVKAEDFPVKLSLRHHFLQIKNGIIPGLQYNVVLGNAGLGAAHFVLITEPVGPFGGGIRCDSGAVVGSIPPNSTLILTAFHAHNQSWLFSFDVMMQGDEAWYTSIYEYPTRSECYLISPKEDITISSEELEIQDFKTVLIQAPQTSGLQINIDDVIIQEDKSLFIYNVSESSKAVTLSYTKQEPLTFVVLEDHLLLIDNHWCIACRFQLIIRRIATKYECNSTLSLSRGLVQLTKPPRACQLFLRAKPFHRIILKVIDMSAIGREDCYLQKLVIGPLAGNPNQKIWTPCYNVSEESQTEVYISKSNVLKMEWSSSMNDVLLNYEFFLPCFNQIYGEMPIGHFCSTGYPDIIFGCNQTYSIYVPFGYSIELKVTVSGMTTGAFCHNNTFQVATRDESKTEIFLLILCLDATAKQNEVFALRSLGDSIDFRITSSSDRNRMGFCASYKAVLLDTGLLASCPYGWTSGDMFCYRVYGDVRKWEDAERACQRKGGHLASITDSSVALMVDQVIKNSPIYDSSNAFWIGANDLRYENCFEWTDGQPFDFYHWFPGWEIYGGYSVQPSDDGLSQQNCVELRNVFRYPSKGEGVTDRFFWNDRDCLVRNPFVCQILKRGVTLDPVGSCNRTIRLTWEHSHEILTSPGFPRNYPNSIECHYYISAPQGHKIVALFTDFILEESDSCEYDVLTVLEGEDTKWSRCGDWERQIKLLRLVSHRQSLRFVFASDFSHSRKGFRVEFSILADKSDRSTLCDNDMFQLKGGHCYLVVTYPETSWGTARQICSEAKAQLAIVENGEQVAVFDELVRSTYGYMSGVIYWVGAVSTTRNSTWKWLDGSFLNAKHMHVSRNDDSRGLSCLAIQWKQLRSANVLRWTSKNCNHPGRFICQKASVVIPGELNTTMSQLNGNLTSVNYPSYYLNDMDYRVEILGPPNSRVVVTFHYFHLEWQEDCLYDYVLLQTTLIEKGLKLCGEHLSNREFISASNTAYVSFHSDFSITAAGYAASWESVDLSARRLLLLEPTHITSVRYPRAYLPGVECRVTAIASEPTKRILVTVGDLDLRPQDFLEINLDPEEVKKIKLCDMDFVPGMQMMAYGNEAQFLFRSSQDNTTGSLPKRGYNLTCETWAGTTLENTLYLNENKKGRIYSMNFIHQQPIGFNYSQRVLARVGYKIHIRSLQMSQPRSPTSDSCDGSRLIIRDQHARQTTLFTWTPCHATKLEEADGLWSTLNVLHIDALNSDGLLPSYYLEYSVTKDDHFANATQSLTSYSVESCRPNPCQHGGRCISNGTNQRCHCFGQYTGLFCHLTWCDANVCGQNGFCNLTSTGWKCECYAGNAGPRCQKDATPCFPNPCGENGFCSPRNDSYSCRCAVDYEGPRCEKLLMRIPYKPLSERMLEEPFWLGLITVFSVLLIILLVYCIKRKFADKIEKFLAEEIERSKYQPSPPVARYSLSSTQPSLTPGNQSPHTCPKSLFSRIRKNSILSATQDREASHTFEDILRTVHSSKRRLNNPSFGGPSALNPTSREAEDDKSRILASLVTPQKEAAARRMSLDEFFRMSERKIQMSTRRTNRNAADATDANDDSKETSFMNLPSPKALRRSFLKIQSIQEQSTEYMSSSESLNEEPSTSEVQADVSPTPPAYCLNPNNSEGKLDDNLMLQTHSNALNPTDRTMPNSISIRMDNGESDNKPDSESNATNFDSKPKSDSCNTFTALSPILSRNSSYLEVPNRIPEIQVFSAESDELQNDGETLNCNFTQDTYESLSPCRKNFLHARKYSVDLPMPKILITTNTGSCDSDEASPPRTPNPNKSMMYLSPLAVISTDRTISESNLSTSGYSSISSPGLSRCNSSSPISDDVEHNNHPNCSHNRSELQSPKKPYGVQMTYLSVGGNDKTFFFPQTIACHCHTPSSILEPKPSPSVSAVWTPGKRRLLCKRSSYQTTSTDDSIDDEGIGVDLTEFAKGRRDADITGASEHTSAHLPVEPANPDVCSINSSKSGAGKGSPRTGMRKGDKPKKDRRSPVLSPVSTPATFPAEGVEVRIPRNSSHTSMSGPPISSSESDNSEGYSATTRKNPTRRSKKHEAALGAHKQTPASMPSQDSSGPKSSDATERSSPLSESNGDSAPMDSRSPVSSSLESLSSTRDHLSEKALSTRMPVEPTRSFPLLSQCLKHNRVEGSKMKIEMKKSKSPAIRIEAAEIRTTEDHPYLRRQEAIMEDDPSEDSSSETTVLLGKQAGSPPRNLQRSSSADISEWEAFSKD